MQMVLLKYLLPIFDSIIIYLHNYTMKDFIKRRVQQSESDDDSSHSSENVEAKEEQMNIEMQKVFLQVFLDSTTIEEHALRAYN